jgi:phenylacetate-CoA ligase
MIRHCAATVPFYRRRFRALGIDPSRIKAIDDLQCLPILTKRDVQDNFNDLVSTAVPRSECTWAHTSGTTGSGLRFLVTRRATQATWATWWRYRLSHGIRMDTWCGYFGGRSVVPTDQKSPPFWRINLPGRQVLFSGYHLSEANLPAYLAELRHRRPPWLHGYPSLIALLAAYVIATGADLGYELRWITTGAENLLTHQREAIERAFGVRPIQHYGLAEGVANMSQCGCGSLHIDEDFAAVELVAQAAGLGHRIVGTTLLNEAMPLVRYDVCDVATPNPFGCSCTTPGRVVSGIDGRIEDYLVLPDGTRIGRMDHVFKDMTGIREAQIVQKQVGQMLVRVVRGDYNADDEARLLAECRKRVGRNMQIDIEYVQRLERSAAGKLRLVVSEIPGAGIHDAPAFRA